MRTDLRILLFCLVGLMPCLSAWNLLGNPQKTYAQLTMDQQKTQKAGSRLAIATVEKGDRSGTRGPLQTVIRNQDEWKALWKRHSSTEANPPPAPLIDFDREMAVGVFLGEKHTGGYEVEIVRAERRDSALYVYYREKSPPPGTMVTQALIQPFHLVKFPKYEKLQVIFRRDS